jgi:hypothetical protein
MTIKNALAGVAVADLEHAIALTADSLDACIADLKAAA